MTVSNRANLKAHLVEDYDGLIRKLTRRFGSSDFATETLHETFARLDRVADQTLVQKPTSYILRAAINIGNNRLRAEKLRASAAEIEEILNLADGSPTPVQVLETRSEIDVLQRVLKKLPERTRQIFVAVLFESKPYSEIASQMGVSVRTIERNVQRAVELCAKRIADMS